MQKQLNQLNQRQKFDANERVATKSVDLSFFIYTQIKKVALSVLYLKSSHSLTVSIANKKNFLNLFVVRAQIIMPTDAIHYAIQRTIFFNRKHSKYSQQKNLKDIIDAIVGYCGNNLLYLYILDRIANDTPEIMNSELNTQLILCKD